MSSGRRGSVQQDSQRLAILDSSRFSPGFYPTQGDAAHAGDCLFRPRHNSGAVRSWTMTLQYLQSLLLGINEVRVTGGSFIHSGTTCHALGLLRRSDTVDLVFLQYSEAYAQQREEAEIAALNGLAPCSPAPTNRAALLEERVPGFPNALDGVHKVFLGETPFDVNTGETSVLCAQDWDDMTIISAFLRGGWQPGALQAVPYGAMFLTKLELSGSYDTLAQLPADLPLRIAARPTPATRFVEKATPLSVGARYSAKRVFREKGSSQEHWYYINRVYLMDMWAESARIFQDPCLTENFTPKELWKKRTDYDEILARNCPKGTCYPVVEYESENGILLEFYLREHLDAKPIPASDAFMILVKPEKKTGRNGFPLKAALIQTPVPRGTRHLDAELFSFIQAPAPLEFTLA